VADHLTTPNTNVDSYSGWEVWGDQAMRILLTIAGEQKRDFLVFFYAPPHDQKSRGNFRGF